MKQLNVLDLPRHWSNLGRNYETIISVLGIYSTRSWQINPIEEKDLGESFAFPSL